MPQPQPDVIPVPLDFPVNWKHPDEKQGGLETRPYESCGALSIHYHEITQARVFDPLFGIYRIPLWNDAPFRTEDG